MSKYEELQAKIETIQINGEEYVKKTCLQEKANTLNGLEYVICRTHSAGVFAGYLEKKEGQEITLKNARRIWYWDGAASLSQLATEGTNKPENCKFPITVDKVILLNVIEIIPITLTAQKSIEGVKIWKV